MFDVLLSLLGLFLTTPLIILILVLGYFENGSPIFQQKRLGQHKRKFMLIKFRTMPVDTPSVASHLVSEVCLTPFGRFLRKTKLDELPQLWNVLAGDMSLVGPRPNLYNQAELIREREQRGVYDVRPGITGLAQIKRVDMSRPRLLAKIDAKMIAVMSPINYFNYIFLTIAGKGRGDSLRN